MPRKLLVAEDSVTMQKLVAMTLSSEGVSVTAVSSGQEVIPKAKELRPDLILADVRIADIHLSIKPPGLFPLSST